MKITLNTEIWIDLYLSDFKVVGKTESTLYLRLPETLRRPIESGCDCPYCKAHPKLKPLWDTLAAPLKPTGSDDHCWVVHHPEVERLSVIEDTSVPVKENNNA